jgi:hypothetical protein
VQSHPHPLLGRDGETLAMDVARFGAADARRLLLVSSACHGVEGFCGSGVQGALLADRAAAHAPPRLPAWLLLYMHALNPYGFSWWRRVTHENVDLNRNWHDFPAAAGQPRLRRASPTCCCRPLAARRRGRSRAGLDYAARMAPWACRRPSARPAHHPQGLFYGGRNPTWSQQTCAMCCATRHAAHAWAGSTCTPAWAPAATASASLQAATTPPAMARARAGGVPR